MRAIGAINRVFTSASAFEHRQIELKHLPGPCREDGAELRSVVAWFGAILRHAARAMP